MKALQNGLTLFIGFCALLVIYRTTAPDTQFDVLNKVSPSHKVTTQKDTTDLPPNNLPSITTNFQQKNKNLLKDLSELTTADSSVLSKLEIKTINESLVQNNHQISFQKLSEITNKLSTCLKHNLCGETPTPRGDGGVMYFDPHFTAHHSLLRKALNRMETAFFDDSKFANEVSPDVFYNALDIPHASVPLVATSIITRFYPETITAQKLISPLKNIDGPIKAKVITLISQSLPTGDEDVKEEVTQLLTQHNDTSWEVFKRLHRMNVDDNDFIQLAQSACAIKNANRNSMHEERRFNLALQGSLAKRQLDIAPNEICPQ